MQNSGTKLVLALVGTALLLGVVSWWYRFETAHRATQFWGPEASRLIAESENFEVWEIGPAEHREAKSEPRNLSRARGQAHLRHALLSDTNYLWDEPLNFESITWRWKLRFFNENAQASVLLSGDLAAIGRNGTKNGEATAYSCQPMTSSLKQYFEALELVAKPTASTATE